MRIHTALTKRFAVNLKEWRIEAGLSQGELARLMGIAENYVYLLERGDRAPSFDMVEKAANVLKKDPSQLLKEIA